MASRAKRRPDDRSPQRPRLPAKDEASPRGLVSGTAVAIEAIRTGVLPLRPRRRSQDVTHDVAILVGDPDDRRLDNEYVGDETPGGSATTPDQNMVDDIGRVYGLQEEDTGELHCAGEVLTRRDRHRSELRPPRRRFY
jgi:hypothetical protein